MKLSRRLCLVLAHGHAADKDSLSKGIEMSPRCHLGAIAGNNGFLQSAATRLMAGQPLT